MSKLPENCPLCGKKMEKGYLRAESGLRPTQVVWKTPETSQWRGGEKLNFGLIKADFRGVRCKDCKIVILGYSEEMKKSMKS